MRLRKSIELIIGNILLNKIFLHSEIIYDKIPDVPECSCPYRKISTSFISDVFLRITGSSLIDDPIKCLNSSGDISPSPLNRVISGLGLNSYMPPVALHRSNNTWSFFLFLTLKVVSAVYKDVPF
jgi:hypothetical protein